MQILLANPRGFCAGVNMAIRRSVIPEVGLFDEALDVANVAHEIHSYEGAGHAFAKLPVVNVAGADSGWSVAT